MNKTLWLMVGIPGSGKTYFATHTLNKGLGWRYISRDIIRFSIIHNDEEYFSHETDVFNEFISQIKHSINEEGIFNIIADATHLNWNSRKKLLNVLNLKDIDIIPVVMQTDFLESVHRNESRSGRMVVPNSVIKNMQAQLTDPKNDNFKYTAIMYVNNNTNGREK